MRVRANPCDRNPVLRYGPGPLRCAVQRSLAYLPLSDVLTAPAVYVLRFRQVTGEHSRRQRPARQQTR
jgi:hypothetical protein